MITYTDVGSTSSVAETQAHVAGVLIPVAKKLGFTISPFDNSPKTSDHHIFLLHDEGLEPAPITSAKTASYELMGGTCKTVFGPETVISPTGMFGAVWGLDYAIP